MLLSAEKITKSYGEKSLFREGSIYLQEGEKIGIIGVNGSGKSTLLAILAKVTPPDSGTIFHQNGIRVEYLQQNPVWDENLTIFEHVFAGAAAKLIDAKEYEAKTILTKLGLTTFDKPIRELSGGQRRRVAIATALIHPCDVLLLDEPTNHLDNDMVIWLEKYLIKFSGSIIMVTHDRYFLDRITKKIVEIDQGEIYTYDANYTEYLARKLQREESAMGSLRKNQSLHRKEREWILQGAKARGTKSKERIARYEALADSVVTEKTDRLSLSSVSSRLGKKIVEINHVTKRYGDLCCINDFSYLIARDARIGIVGKNGCGKSSLLNIISGKLAPDDGEVVLGETIKIGYFTQECADMDISLRVIDYAKNIAEYIETPEGKVTASKMLETFLFPPSSQWNFISKLSGGERRRLYLLSILMSAPNLLLLDEPTNDLDIETLCVLEAYLESFQGPVIVVSHDRFFLDRTADTIFAFEEDGTIQKYMGEYSDYLQSREQLSSRMDGLATLPTAKTATAEPNRPSVRSKKRAFTYKEQKDFDTIDEEIAQLEKQIATTTKSMAEASDNYVLLLDLMKEKDEYSARLDERTERWIYLQELAEKINEERESPPNI